MAEILAAQRALVAVIKNFSTMLQATLPDDWMGGMIQARTEVLQGYWADFQSNHLALIVDAIPAAEYDPGTVYGEIEQTYLSGRSLLYDISKRLEPAPFAQASFDQSGQFDQSRLAPGTSLSRLPQIDLPTFSGRREDWESFRDLFRALIHEDPRLNDVARFFYLKTHVQGEAKAALETLKLTSSNYASAWRLLEARYEHRRLLVHDHLMALQNLRPMREESSAGLQSLHDTFCRHHDQLKALNRPVDAWDDWFVSIAASCMDPLTRRAWEDDLEKSNRNSFDATRPDAEATHLEDAMATFSTVTEFIQRRCHTMSSVESSGPSRSSSGRFASGHSSSHTSNRPFRSFATRVGSTPCSMCSEAHYIGHCERFLGMPPDVRRDAVLRARLCFNCLRSGHSARACLSNSVCQLCQALHHTLLHNSLRKRSAPAASSPAPTKKAKLSHPGVDVAASDPSDSLTS